MRGWLVMVFVVGCNKGDRPPPQQQPAPPPASVKPAPVAAKSVRRATVEETYVVVLPRGADVDATMKRVSAKLAPLGGEARVMPPEKPTPEMREATAAMNKDLTAADLDGILSNTAIAMRATGEPLATMRALATIAFELAKQQHGWVVDPDAGAAYTAAQFEKHVPGDPIDVREVIYVHGVQGDNSQPFLDTMGMEKLGLPDLRVSAAASGQLGALTVLIDATAQQLVAKDAAVPGPLVVDLATLPGEWHVDEIKKAGGTAKARWQIAWAKDPDSGEDELELVPAQGSGVEGAVALIDDCFGKAPDPVAQIKANDPELEAAAVTARADLRSRHSHFAKGVPAGEHLAIKAPFHDGDITEWMWVDVVAWKGDTFVGSLDNDPESVKNVKVGQTVRVKLADVADFIAVAPDGSQSGGYSVEVMKKRGLIQ
jgi:uncharacterized protein YegJ (DUF2314 family)